MIKTRKELKEYLAFEEKIYKSSTSHYSWIIFKILPLDIYENAILYKYIRLLRKTEYHLNNNHRLRGNLFKFMLRRSGYKHGLSIPINVFDIGLNIRHLAQTRVASQAKIGKNFKIHPFVSIGTNNNEEAPVIGDNVIIFSGARVIGGIKLANNIMVAANAVVTKSCDVDGAVLAGIPAKIINVKEK